MIERIYLSPRGQVHYWVTSPLLPDAPVLVLLHGLTADHRLFERQTEAFAGEYNLIVWDAPCHGKSRPYTDFSYAHAVEELAGILADCGISQKVVLAGQSLGGYFAQPFIECYPDHAAGFIGIDTTPYGDGYYSKSDCWWLRQVEWMAKCFPEKLLKSAIAQQVGRTAYAQRNMSEILAQYTKDEIARLMGIAYADFLTDNHPIDLTCPVLLLLGAHDTTGKVKQYNQKWAERTGFPLTIVPDAAHNSNADAPDFVNGAIRQFVDALPKEES